MTHKSAGITCKLFYYEEYETPIGRMLSDHCKETTAGQWRYKYEKVKNYFDERKFKTEQEAMKWGMEKMYEDEGCHYEIVKEPNP